MALDELMTEKTSEEAEENTSAELSGKIDDINRLKNNIRNVNEFVNRKKGDKEDSEDNKEDIEDKPEEGEDGNEKNDNAEHAEDRLKENTPLNDHDADSSVENYENPDSPSRTIEEQNQSPQNSLSSKKHKESQPDKAQNNDNGKQKDAESESLSNKLDEKKDKTDELSKEKDGSKEKTGNDSAKETLSNSDNGVEKAEKINTIREPGANQSVCQSSASLPTGTSEGAAGAATGSGAAASSGAAAGGAAASGGAAAAGGAAVAVEAAPVLAIVLGIIAAIFLFIVIFSAIYSYASPKYVVETVGKAVSDYMYNFVDDAYELMKGFYFSINPFADAPTSDESLKKANVSIPQANTDYDPKNPQDMAYLEELKLIQVALSKAYDKSLEVLEDKCDNCGYDYTLTLNAIKAKYPNGWKDVYKNVNYGEFIIMMYFYMHDKEDMWGNSMADIQEMISDYETAVKNGNQNAISFSGKRLGMIEDLILSEDSAMNLYQMGYTIASSGDKKYLNIEIKPYCWNQIYEMIGRTPEGLYDEKLDITYSEMMDIMLKNMRATNEDSLGRKRAMYNTLKLDNNGIEWQTSFKNNSIHDLYALCNVPEINDYNGQILYIMLRAEGYEPAQAAGICGNVRLKNFYKTEISADGKTVGLCNWDMNTDGKKLQEFAKQLNADPYSIYTQSAFLISIMRNDGTEAKIKAETGIRQSTDIFCIAYEKEKSFKGKSEWKNAKPGTEWESYTYSYIDGRYHYNLEKYRDSASEEYAKYRGLPIMFWPAPGNDVILRDYGVTTNDKGVQTGHKGIDIKCAMGDNIVAAACGTVERTGYNSTEGNFITIEHNSGYKTKYMHLSEIAINEGDVVLAGQTIGYAGRTGNAAGVHLHFSVQMPLEEYNGKMKYVSPWTVTNSTMTFENALNEIIKVAESVIGKIPYVYGGKAKKPGYDERWGNNTAGLDCSGFVQWVYWTVTGTKISGLGSTASITSTQQEIGYNDLKPGDLGVKFKGGSNASTGNYNHVGIYAGKDAQGNDVWIHCTGGSLDNVVRNNYSGFKVYYRVNLED